jgi:hypothetical protein
LQQHLSPLAATVDPDRDVTGGHDSGQVCSRTVQISTGKRTSRRVRGDVQVEEVGVKVEMVVEEYRQ